MIFFVVTAVAVNILVSVNLYQDAVDSGKAVVKNIANQVQERIGESERDLIETQKIISKNLLTPSTTNDYLESIVKDNKFFTAIEILDSSGKVLNAAPSKFQAVGMDRSGQTFYKNINGDGEIYWSDLFNLMVNGEPTIAISMPDKDKIFVAYLDIREVSRILMDYNLHYEDDIEIFMMDAKGTYISNSEESMIQERNTNKDIEQIKATVDSEQGYFEDKASNQLINVAYIENPEWYVAQYTPKDYILMPIQKAHFLFYFLLGIGMLLTVLYYRKAKAFSTSITEFSEQTRLISNGNYEREMNDQEFRELQTLGDNFNAMTTELKERDSRLIEYAYVDSLTGLPNRRAMTQKLEGLIKEKVPFAIVYFDLDQFKNVNDSCGHFTGDIVLNNVSKRITLCIDGDGFLARIGGDEFLYLITDDFSEAHVKETLELIIASVSEAFYANDMELFIGVSAGIAIYPENADNFADILKFSDMAMYSAKGKGMNKYEWFSDVMSADFDRKMEIERQLRSAIERDEFECVFQPQIELKTGRIIGFESLIRWKNHKLGNVSPDEFIQIAETKNLISDITTWMLHKSLEGVMMLYKQFGRSFKISINASVADFKRKEFPDEVMQIIKETGMEPRWVEIEITENMLIDNYDEMVSILYRLKEYGIRISLDDFGKGYSSLSYLNRLPIDTLKIDREFLDANHFNERGHQLIEAVIGIGEKFNFMVVAEGIETNKQYEMLKKNNCYAGQGYLMCRPIGLDELVVYIENLGFES
jgi:diguanylate cyclase (GGDEF)-like protein